MGNTTQQISDFNALYSQAIASQEPYKAMMNAYLAELKLRYPTVLDSVRFEQGDLKTPERALDKINGDYKGHVEQIADLVRGRLVVTNPEQADILRRELAAGNTPFKIEKFKDQFADPTNTHFRAVNTQVRLSNGHVAEFRVEHEAMLNAAKASHEPYERNQEIERRAKKENRDLTPEERRIHSENLEICRAIHNNAAASANLDGLLSEKGRAAVDAARASLDQRSTMSREPPRASTAQADGTDKPPQTPDQPHPHRLPHQPHAPRIPGAAGVGATAVTSGAIALATGASLAQAARATGESALSNIPGVGGRLAPNRDEAAVRDWVDTATMAGTTVGAVAGAIIGTPVPVAGNAGGAIILGAIGNQIAAIGADEYYRIKARHFEGKKDTVAPSMGEQLFMAALSSSIEKTIPAAVMQTDTRFRTSQDNVLKDAGLGEKDKNGRTPADYLRGEQTRDAFLGVLKDSLSKETNPKAREQIGHLVEACEKFLEMEGRRVARLQPYMKEIEEKLAATLKVQHLAAKFKEDNPTPSIAATSSMAATAPPHSNGTAAGRG